MIWYEHRDDSEAKPNQWYYKGAPCEWVGAAVDEKTKKHLGNRYKLRSGDLVEVFWKDGELPGVTYEILKHSPGRA